MYSALISLQTIFTRYGMSTYVAFGNIGNLLTIAIFAQREQRRNPCSLYLLAMTICNLICLDVATIPIIFSLDHMDIRTNYPIACKLQYYIRHTLSQMMRTYKILACIDRYALSSMEARIRSFSEHRMAFHLILLSAVFWSLSVVPFAYERTIENNQCDIHSHLLALIYTIYYLIFAGILPPLLILIFSFLLMQNLKRMRTQIQSQSPKSNREGNSSMNILRKRDRDLMKMVLIEVMFYVISTTPFSFYLVYKIIADDFAKGEEQKEIEAFINYLTQSFLMYLNTALPFYIYVTTSPSFRRELRKKIWKFIRLIRQRNERRFFSSEQQHETEIQLHLLKNENTEQKIMLNSH